MTEQTATEPSDDDRRRAACMAMGSAPGLIRFAARYTRSLHDAEDAYQRAMEIALTKAPVTEERRFMAWLHTVLRNEALAVARGRRREGPSPEADVPEAYAGTLEEAVSLDALAEWRERYRSIQDGLAGLTHAQRVCLMLQTAGVSYERIREITGFSLRKVERSVLEGRASLAAWEVRLATGEDCERMDPLIGLVAGGRASSRETRIVSRHLRNCGPCRALLRDRRESNEWLAGLVPIAFLGGHAFSAAPDPGPALAWWERVSGGATVRMGSLIQMAMELPSSALAKVGAGTAAVAVAGVAAVPIVADTVRPADGVPPVAAAVATEIRPGVAGDAGRRHVASFPRERRAATVARVVTEARPRRSAPRPKVTRPERTATAEVSGPAGTVANSQSTRAPSPPAPPAQPPSSAVALEFGP